MLSEIASFFMIANPLAPAWQAVRNSLRTRTLDVAERHSGIYR